MESKLDQKALYANKNIKLRHYWKSRFYGFDFNTYFQDKPIALINSTEEQHAVYNKAIPAPIAARLSTVAATPKAQHVILMAALGVLAQKCSSLNDVCIFTSSYNKGEEIVASETTLVPVRMTDFAKLGFSGFLGILKNQLTEDLSNAAYPIEKKVEDNYANLKQIGIVGLIIDELQLLSPEDRLTFDLLFTETVKEETTLSVHYKATKFDSDYIERLVTLYIDLLAYLLNHSTEPIESVQIISEKEKELITSKFNNTDKAFPQDKTILDFFIAQVKANPAHIALKFGEEQLSYLQLEEKSNQVANYLIANFDCKQKVIGVFLDRSIEMMVAIFGILKAGSIYLPISKNYPQQRTIYTLENSEATIIFAEKSDFDIFTDFTCVETSYSENYPTTACNLAHPDLTAYVIYTSGSTGKPKGVLIKHLSIVNRLNWMQNEYLLQPDDVILQKTPIVFDVSIWELFWWSMCGATLVLAKPGAEKDPEQLCQVIEKEKITVLHFVPSMLNIFLVYLEEYSTGYAMDSIRHLFCSGEELKPTDAKRFLNYCPAARLHNLYGPTEATVDVSYHEVLPLRDYRFIPIGKPIDNTTLFIFNKDGQLQPVGFPGELHIGGVNLSIGYMNQEALTKEKFILNPLDNKSTLYKTGDLARWLPNGEIEFLGRIDNQVKIRGNRIEFGEIEHTISLFETVKNVVVLAKETNGILQLFAYLVTTPNFSEEELLVHLAAGLPEYMIPSYFLMLDEIPVTENGKINKAHLLSLKKAVIKYVAPETILQQELSIRWISILGNKEVAIDDNFFRSGGDSILAVKLIGTINNEMALTLSVIDLYENGTIRELAAFIEQSIVAELSEVEQKIEIYLAQFEHDFLKNNPDPQIEAVYPMSDLEKLMCLSQQLRPDDLLYFKQTMQPVTYQNFNINFLQQAVDLLVQKHAILRTGFDLENSAHIVYLDRKVIIELRDLSHLSYDAQKIIVANELEQSRDTPFNPDRSLLWRFIVYKLAIDHHELLFEYHAAMLDGWSMSAFIAELNEIYALLIKNKTVEIEKLSSAYKDFILQELLHKNDGKVRDYWSNELKGYKKLNFNNDQGSKVYRSVRQRSTVALVEALEQAATKEKTTVKNILFAAYVYALSLLSGETDILVGLLSFNRPVKKDGDKMLGCFLNTIPVRIQIPERITWKSFQRLIDSQIQETKKYETLSLFEINQLILGASIPENQLFDTVFNFVRWHLLENMQLEPMNDIGVDRLDFDSFVRRSTSFDVSYNLNPERILNMHEYATPFMNDELFENYTMLFDAIIQKMIHVPDETIDRLWFNSLCVDREIKSIAH